MKEEENKQTEGTKLAVQIGSNAVATIHKQIQDHFIFNPNEGFWEIDRNNIPTPEESMKLIEDVTALKMAASMIESQSSWLIGNIVSELRDVLGDELIETNLDQRMGRTWHTLLTSETVFRAFKGRRIPGLTFTQHKDIFYTKGISDEDKIELLKIAREYKFNTIQTRKLARMAREQGLDMFKGATPLMMDNLIEKMSKKEKKYITVSYDERVRLHTEATLTESVMKSSKIIILIKPGRAVIKIDKENI
jgi:hypothetical protein